MAGGQKNKFKVGDWEFEYPVYFAGGIRLEADGTLTDFYAEQRHRDSLAQEIMDALPGVTAQEVIAAVGEKRARHGGSSIP